MPKEYVVKVKCEVIKELIVRADSKYDAMINPYGDVIDERELEQPNWEVISVEENA